MGIRKIVLAGVAAVALAGCATSGVDEAKALYVGTAAFDGAAQALDLAARSGLLKGQAAATAAEDLTKAYDALVAARSAYALGQSGTVDAQLVALTSLVAEIEALAKPAATTSSMRALDDELAQLRSLTGRA